MQEVQNLPKGGVNRGCVVPLQCGCPQNCPCGNSNPRVWYHQACGCPAYISQYGDIFCKNFQIRNDCKGYFIQDASFQCEVARKSQTWMKHATPSRVLMSIAQAVQAASFHYQDQHLLDFAQNLVNEVNKRWHR